MISPARFDPGLQPERTLLAWRRTVLSLAVGGLVGLRMLPESLGTLSVFFCLTVLGATVALHIVAERRCRRTYAELLASRPLSSAGPVLLAASILVTACALGGAWWVIACGTSGS